MSQGASIFETHYNDYMRQIASVDVSSGTDTLGARQVGNEVVIRFFDRDYFVSGYGIRETSGARPDYGVCVILAKYLLSCPEHVYDDPQWVSFREFKKTSHFINVNIFTSDVEQALARHFSGRGERLRRAGEQLGGVAHDSGAAYDMSMRFEALARVRLLLLFNDSDEEFPAQCKVLFQKHAEFYLDPESLAMIGISLATRLMRAAGK